MESTDPLEYKSLDHDEMLRIFNDRGVVSILMPSKHSKACCMSLKIVKYYKYEIKSKRVARLQKFGMLILGLFSILRNLLFHRELLSVSSFYVLAGPMKCGIRKIDNDSCLLVCEKARYDF